MPFWHYLPDDRSPARSRRPTTPIDALGARSADAPISVAASARPSTGCRRCRPNPAATAPSSCAIRTRPGATRRFARDLRGRRRRPAARQRVPDAARRAATSRRFDAAAASLGCWGVRGLDRRRRTCRARPFEGEDRVRDRRPPASRGVGPPRRAGHRRAPAAGQLRRRLRLEPGASTLARTAGDARRRPAHDDDGDRLSAEITLAAGARHGRRADASRPALTACEKLRIAVHARTPGFDGPDSVTVAIGDASGTSQALDFAIYVRRRRAAAPPGVHDRHAVRLARAAPAPGGGDVAAVRRPGRCGEPARPGPARRSARARCASSRASATPASTRRARR